MRRDRRQQTLQSWRARRAGRGLEPASLDGGGMRRHRRRHRAPTPSLVPRSGLGVLAAARVVAALTLVGLVVVLALWAWRSPALHVTQAVVRGNERAPAEAVFQASGIDGRHALAIDWREAERRVGDLGGIRQAHIRFRWPGGATIAVIETAPVLLWSTPWGTLAIDETGLAVPPGGAAADLPLVRDTAGLVSAPGERLAPELVDAVLAYAGRLRDLELTKDGGFVGTSEQGWRVRLGMEPGLAPRQLAVLDAAARQLAPEADGLTVLDLRYPTRPYYRRQEGAN